MSDVTRILSQIEQGDPQAAEQLLPLVYDELRKLAAAKLAQEKPGQTLQATALVHDAYIRMVDHQQSQRWDNRGHFFVAAAEAMRRILVDSARRRQSLKRGGGLEHQSLDDLAIAGPEPDDKMLAVSEALEQLSATDKTAAELVKLRYFAGLTGKNAAAALGLAERSADRVWVYARAQELLSLKGGGLSVAVSPDRKRLASGSWDGTLNVWDADTGDELITFKAHIRGVDGVDFSPDGNRLASSSFTLTGIVFLQNIAQVKVWDVKSGQEIWGHTSTGPFSKFSSVAFSPDGQRLASASWDKTLKVWDAETGQELRALQGHTGRVQSVVFSPDSKRLVSTAQDESVKVWDAESGQELLTFKRQCQGAAFSSDGQRLFSGSSDGTVMAWDATPLPEKP